MSTEAGVFFLLCFCGALLIFGVYIDQIAR